MGNCFELFCPSEANTNALAASSTAIVSLLDDVSNPSSFPAMKYNYTLLRPLAGLQITHDSTLILRVPANIFSLYSKQDDKWFHADKQDLLK